MRVKTYEDGKEIESSLKRSGLIFLDVGARKAELLNGHFFNEDLSVREDRQICSVKSFEGCHMFLVEPDPNHFIDLCESAKKASKVAKSVTVVCAGLWSSTGRSSFFRSEGLASDYGSTLLSDKKNPYEPGFERLVLEEPIEIETIDVSDLLKNLSGQIFMKIDTEGGEYVILPRLFDSEDATRIKGLFVEWHDAFFPERHSEFAKKYTDHMSLLVQMGMEYSPWPPEW